MAIINTNWRLIYFPNNRKHVAEAWNHRFALRISTAPHDDTTAALAELDTLCAARDAKRCWFMDHWHYDPVTAEILRVPDPQYGRQSSGDGFPEGLTPDEIDGDWVGGHMVTAGHLAD